MMEEVEHHEIPVSVKSDQKPSEETVQAAATSAPNVIVATSPPSASTSVPISQEQANIELESDSSHGGGWSLTGWFKSASNNQFVQKVMEKTKTGVDKMITTLDPGMTPYIKQGGDISVIVASDKEVKWGAVRDAFQTVFGAATVRGVASKSNVAPQPVGYTAGMKGAQERIKNLRKSEQIDANQLCVAIESFIVEQLPDHWFDVGCILLDDPENDIKFEVFTLAVPVDGDIIADMKKSTPSDFDLRWSGLAVTVGETIQNRLSWIKPSDWHRALCGRSRHDIIYSASLVLAELYKRRLPEKNIEQNI